MIVVRRLWWLGAGVALLVLGGAIVVSGDPPTIPPTDVGWFAYTPLEGPGDLVLLTRRQAEGYAVVGLALLLLTAGAAYDLGRRRPAGD